ncbi:MAG TPA: ArsR family transcriptional regulator [Hyphomonadaceae bacterium]|nr:ArsR family transcriptional regulator [Hyphomonadaceae bacterium]
MKLDAVDELILEALQQDGRLTNKALAARVGLSPPACLERVRRLEQGGVIIGYRAIVDPKAIGAHFEGWAEISLCDQTAETLARFQSLLTSTPAIVSAYQVAGPHDFMLRFLAPSIEAWRHFRACMSDAGVAAARLSMVIDTVKAEAPVCWPPTRPRSVRNAARADLAR